MSAPNHRQIIIDMAEFYTSCNLQAAIRSRESSFVSALARCAIEISGLSEYVEPSRGWK